MDFDVSSLSDSSREAVVSKINSCKGKVDEGLVGAFEEMKEIFSSIDKDKKMKPDISLKYNQTATNFETFKIHECWCTDCDVEFPAGSGNKIPKDTCYKDLTDAQIAFIKTQAKSKYGEDAEANWLWRNRADAANLTPSVGCHTIVHEIYHNLGLPDEYLDRAIYPYSRVDCNIMGAGGKDNFELKGRQMFKILALDQRSCDF
jgi:hypothetical protein